MFVGAGCIAGVPCVTSQPFNGTAFRVSPYLGYNWQLNPKWVVGLEGDFDFADQTTAMVGQTYPATPFSSGATSNSFLAQTTWEASIRGRVGYLVDPAVLLYGTAGPSWIHVKTTANCSTDLAADGACAPGGFPGLAPASISHGHDQLGYTVGGGIEAMLWPNWIARAEYRFADYGRFSNTDTRSSGLGTQTVTYDTAIKTHTATFGLAYRFGNGNAPGAASLAAYAAIPSDVSWSGFYLGAGAGVRANQTKATLDAATVSPLGLASFNAVTGCDCGLSNGYDSTSARVSPYLGYNWQLNPKWVVGLDGDFGFADRRTTQSGNSLPGTAGVFGSTSRLNDSFSVRTKWDASIRARGGYLINPSFLAYLTGGVAWMSVEQTSHCATEAQFVATAPGFTAIDFGGCAPGLRTPAVITQSTVKPGFTIGGGGEMKLGSNWLLRGEYRYADFGRAHFDVTRSCAGSNTITDPAFGTVTVNCFRTETAATSLRLQSHTATFGIAYKFN